MRLHAVYFGGGIFERMARVLEYTAAQHCADWDIDIRRIEPEPVRRTRFANDAHVANTQKLAHWVEAVADAPDGAEMALIDADTFITRPLDDVWDHEFDVAYTIRQGSRFPFNGGVLFLRVGPAVRTFVGAWHAANMRLLERPLEHMRYRRQYGGINQAAFGRLLVESMPTRKLRIAKLPCREWNCEDSSWAHFDPAVTRIVHVKSALRRAVFPDAPKQYPPHIPPLVRLWNALERESRAVPA